MRRSFVVVIVLVSGFILGISFILKQYNKPVSPPAAAVTSSAQSPNSASNAAAAASHVSVPSPVFTPAPVKTPTPVEREASVQAEKDRLANWEWNNDAASLSNILADLNSPEKEIRMAAIDAAVQFNSTNAIPVLRALAENDTDADEKAALMKAADYLALPEFTPGTGTGQSTSTQPSASHGL